MMEMLESPIDVVELFYIFCVISKNNENLIL